MSNEIKLAKESIYKNAFYENKHIVKKTSSIVSELTSRKQFSSYVKEIKINSSLVLQELPEAFNEHFASFGPKLAETNPCIGSTHLDYLADKLVEIISS